MSESTPPLPSPNESFSGGSAAFLRLLGVVYAFAFGSLATQVRGLIGEHGILPAGAMLDRIRPELGAHPWLSAPTVFWWGSSGATIEAVCWLGAALGLAVAFGIAQAPLLAIEWALYLSVCFVGQDFLGFQWDSLLLEAGFLAVWLAPWRLLTRWRDAPAPRLAPLWLLRVLLFRMMVASCAVKLLRNDQTWLGFSALEYHFWTQPLPTWTAFFAHQTPSWIRSVSTFVMLVIEGAMPFGMFLPRPFRLASFVALAGLQLLIGLTGNYGYFNVLTFALCLLLADDGCLPNRWRPSPRQTAPVLLVRRIVGGTFAALWLTLSAFTLGRSFGYRSPPPQPIAWMEEAIGPFRLINGYGLFAHMTTERLEITIEGSNDGVEWRAYEFKWKPGDPRRRPGFVAPLMPRLDWQMWFAALGSWRRSSWFQNFLERLVEGSPDVLALLERNPFPEKPPEQIRARFEKYHFSSWDRWRSTGEWWEAGRVEGYSPIVTRRPEAASP